MLSDFFREHLAVSPMIAIIRGRSVEDTVRLALQCWEHGIRLVEVPTQSNEALEALAALAPHANQTERFVGAGTICTADDVTRAHAAGARYLVAPGLFPDAVRAADALGLPTLPGVLTPTEIAGALAMSLTVQKLFPANALGTSGVRTLRGPFPTVDFVAVGGVSPDDAQDYLDAGAIGVGVGSALDTPASLARFAALRDAG